MILDLLRIAEDERVVVVAPHPDDESLGAASMLLGYPGQTDVFVVSDGSLGNPAVDPEEMAARRKAEFEREIVRRMDALGIDLVCLAGYMRILSDVLLDAYGGRIINIHPSLLPAFRGAHAVEQAVEYGVKVYGITIHYVNAELDGGRIIAQRAFEYDGNDPEEVHRIGQKIEHALYVETIQKLLSNL